MRSVFLAMVGVAALSAGAALAQEGPPGPWRGDANQDGVLTRQEFDAGHDAMFSRLDADNDGQLTREERRAHHRGRHGGDRHGGPMGMHMEHADANNDGNITREEFLARPLEMFARLDANSDGIISSTEREGARERMREHHEAMRGHHAGMGHGHMDRDANNDGQISREEFRAAGAAHFERMDANHDGRVTREEVEALHRERHGR